MDYVFFLKNNTIPRGLIARKGNKNNSRCPNDASFFIFIL